MNDAGTQNTANDAKLTEVAKDMERFIGIDINDKVPAAGRVALELLPDDKKYTAIGIACGILSPKKLGIRKFKPGMPRGFRGHRVHSLDVLGTPVSDAFKSFFSEKVLVSAGVVAFFALPVQDMVTAVKIASGEADPDELRIIKRVAGRWEVPSMVTITKSDAETILNKEKKLAMAS